MLIRTIKDFNIKMMWLGDDIIFITDINNNLLGIKYTAKRTYEDVSNLMNEIDDSMMQDALGMI